MQVVFQAFLACMLLFLGSPPTPVAAAVTNTGIHVTAFAAAKNRKKSGGGGGGGGKKSKKATASTNRGFGAAPPTLLEVLDQIESSTKIRQRYDQQAKKVLEQQPCPCGISSSLTYSECCQPLHLKAQSTGWDDSPCVEPLQVLQSRYTAFSTRNIGYILSTTHPKCRDYRDDRVAWAKSLDKDGMFDSFDFIKLDLLDDDDEKSDDADDDNEAFLSFQVTLQKKKGFGIDDNEDYSSDSQKTTIVTESSRFLRDPTKGTWTYAGGDVRSKVAGLEDTQLNQ